MRTGSTAERLCPIAVSAATGGISPLKTVRRLRPPAQAALAAMAVQRPATNRRAQRADAPTFSAASGTYPFAPIRVHTADGTSPRTELLAEGQPTPVPFASKNAAAFRSRCTSNACPWIAVVAARRSGERLCVGTAMTDVERSRVWPWHSAANASLAWWRGRSALPRWRRLSSATKN